MAEIIKKQSLRNSFEALPFKIKDWLTSERVTYFIVDINKGLSVEGEDIKVIPRLILRLVTKDLDPKHFIDELANELDLSPSAARMLTQEIDMKILKPIEVLLRSEVGVDTKLIQLAAEAKASPILSVLKEEETPTQTSTTPTPSPIQSRPTPPPIPLRPTPPPIPPKPSAPTLIQTEEAAHPSIEQVKKTVPTPPNQDQQIKLKVNVKKTPTWGGSN